MDAEGTITPASQGQARVKARVLVVDDEPSARSGLEKLLAQEGYRVDVAADGLDALVVAAESPPDVVVTDLKMPKMDGVTLLTKLRAQDPDLPVLVVTAFGDVASAVNAMRAGAADYLTKPVDFDALLVSIERAIERRELRSEADELRRQLREREGDGLGGLIGASPAMQKVYRTAKQVAGARATVLITGESGTGKGELARAIHQQGARAPRRPSSRCTAPRWSSRCSRASSSATSAAPSPARTSGASGASSKLTAARSSSTRWARSPRPHRSSSSACCRSAPSSASVATSRSPSTCASSPPRTETWRPTCRRAASARTSTTASTSCTSTCPRSASETTTSSCSRTTSSASSPPTTGVRIDGFSDRARAKLVAHRWPGNVRELENAIERAVVLCEGQRIEEEHLPIEVAPVAKGAVRIPGATMAEIERFAILSTLEATSGSTTKAAEMLDISVRTIQYRLHEYGVAMKKRGAGEV